MEQAHPSDLFRDGGKHGKPRTSSQTSRDFNGGAVELEVEPVGEGRQVPVIRDDDALTYQSTRPGPRRQSKYRCSLDRRRALPPPVPLLAAPHLPAGPQLS